MKNANATLSSDPAVKTAFEAAPLVAADDDDDDDGPETVAVAELWLPVPAAPVLLEFWAEAEAVFML
jgi:hypothetical protein